MSDGWEGGGELVVNAEFLRFATHWGFKARACRCAPNSNCRQAGVLIVADQDGCTSKD